VVPIPITMMPPRSAWCRSAKLVTNGKRRETRHRGHGRDHPDPGCIDADRFQPDREERQVRADEAEARAVDQRQPGRESPGGGLRSDGDLSGGRHQFNCDSGEFMVIVIAPRTDLRA